MKTDRKKLLVLGIGNLLLGDEGVGVRVVQELEKRTLPEGVECLDGGTGSFYLLEAMQSADRILLIDAAASEDEPGTIRMLRPKYSKEYPKTLTSHDIGLKDLLDSFYLMDSPKNVLLMAITIDPNQSLSMDLSPSVSEAARRAVEMVWEEIKAA